MVMSNLFSIFDPTLGVLLLPYLVSIFMVFAIPVNMWKSGMLPSKMDSFLLTVKKEVNYSLPKNTKGTYSSVGAIFLTLLLMNFTSLFPHIFSMTSLLSTNFPLSFSFWVGIVFFSWTKSFSSFLGHLVPSGTPLGLVSFMVLVELLSNFIRPMALTFRLTANMMAGHLLLSLIGGALLSSSFMITVLGVPLQMMLMFMELGVSVIQAYVFATLTLLYVSESN